MKQKYEKRLEMRAVGYKVRDLCKKTVCSFYIEILIFNYQLSTINYQLSFSHCDKASPEEFGRHDIFVPQKRDESFDE